MQRQRVGHAADVTRHDGHGAELAHRARRAQDDAVDQPVAHAGQRDAAKHLPARRAEQQRGFLLFASLGLHHRDQLARDER